MVSCLASSSSCRLQSTASRNGSCTFSVLFTLAYTKIISILYCSLTCWVSFCLLDLQGCCISLLPWHSSELRTLSCCYTHWRQCGLQYPAQGYFSVWTSEILWPFDMDDHSAISPYPHLQSAEETSELQKLTHKSIWMYFICIRFFHYVTYKKMQWHKMK